MGARARRNARNVNVVARRAQVNDDVVQRQGPADGEHDALARVVQCHVVRRLQSRTSGTFDNVLTHKANEKRVTTLTHYSY